MKHNRRQRGYALLLVMLVLVIAVTSLAAIARTSTRQTIQAGGEQRELQRRWGAITCSSLILADPQAAMRVSPSDKRRPGSPRRMFVELGGLAFNFVLADERGKINPDRLTGLHSDIRTAALLVAAQAGLAEPLAVRLTDPPPGDIYKAVFPARFMSFDDVFGPHHPSQLIDAADPAGSPAGRVTCWSDGKVNFRFAGQEVLAAALEAAGEAGQAAGISRYVDQHPNCTLPQLAAGLQLDEQQAKRLGQVLTAEPGRHSLWIIVDSPGRQWHQLRIAGKASGASGGQEWIFQW